MRVFISHSSDDREFAVTLAKALRHMSEFRGRIATWLSSDFEDSASSSIRSSDWIVTLFGNDSPNVLFELGLALGANKPILVAAPATKGLPQGATSVPYVHLSGELEPDCLKISRRLMQLRGSAALERPKDRHNESPRAALAAAALDPNNLESLTSLEFEGYIRGLLEEEGYTVKAPLDRRDGGVDLVIVPSSGEEILVQLKKYSRQSRVSVDSVRNLEGAVFANRAKAGVLISTCGYTAAAKEFSRSSQHVFLRTVEELLDATESGCLNLIGYSLGDRKLSAQKLIGGALTNSDWRFPSRIQPWASADGRLTFNYDDQTLKIWDLGTAQTWDALARWSQSRHGSTDVVNVSIERLSADEYNCELHRSGDSVSTGLETPS